MNFEFNSRLIFFSVCCSPGMTHLCYLLYRREQLNYETVTASPNLPDPYESTTVQVEYTLPDPYESTTVQVCRISVGEPELGTGIRAFLEGAVKIFLLNGS